MNSHSFPPKRLGAIRAAMVGCIAVAVLVLWSTPALSQTPQQLEQLRRNPELVRERIRQSGLSAEQIRERLQQAGYAPTLLDPFMSDLGQPPFAGEIDSVMLRAISGLGVIPLTPDGVEDLAIRVGPEPGAPLSRSNDGELELFGLNVFRGRTTQFQPLVTGPAPPSYRIGPGDEMVLVLTGDVELMHELRVTREGLVVIPQVGQLAVNRLTLEQLRQLLRRRLGQSYSGIQTGTTRFDLMISRLRTNMVFVVGEVLHPGAYQLAAVATVLNALYAAGGPTERANFRHIVVRRHSVAAATFDLYDYLLQGSIENDVVLEQGDVVFVPVHGTRASISGAVLRPAIYELRPGQTLADLVEAAGGFDADAARQRISIARIVPPEVRPPEGPDRVVVDIPLTPLTPCWAVKSVESDMCIAEPVPPFPIEPGDEVTVFEIPSARRAYVELKGSVYHPGTYGLRPRMRLSELIDLAGGFRPAFFTGAHVERLNHADSTRYLIEVPLPSGSLEPYLKDLALEEYDVVTIYGREELREERTVSITGMVNREGPYPYRNGMTLRSLVLMARGMRDGAHLDSVEVARLPADRSQGALATRLRVPIDSTYLFEPDSSTYSRLPGQQSPSNGAPEHLLEPFDQVTVFRQPGFELLQTVTVAGEVRYPGTYALTSRDERVSALVAHAGGLLPTAFVDGARFSRVSGNAGRVSLELAKALAQPGESDDVMLQPGDTLVIPEYVPTVRVEGAVSAPVSLLYTEGAGMDHYIRGAGGYARNADKGRVRVEYANGAVEVKRRRLLFFVSSPTPGPGSVVTVPAKPEGEPVNATQLFGNIAQVLAATVAMVVIATR
jgi:polysaccharide export outer membrane protein